MKYDNELKQLFTLYMDHVQNDKELNVMHRSDSLGAFGIAVRQYLKNSFNGDVRLFEKGIKGLLYSEYQMPLFPNTKELRHALKTYFEKPQGNKQHE